MCITELIEEEKYNNIEIVYLSIPNNESMCIQTEKKYYIGVDYGLMNNESENRVRLAHELGHCVTNSFYNKYATRDVMQKHENRADKWAIEKLIPVKELDRAIENGHTEIWDLADYFMVTENFMRKAVCWYNCENLAIDLYF